MLEATGTVTALNSVDVRPQISSTITKVHIREGQFVKPGQPLFTLDARNDEVNVTKARAQLAKDHGGARRRASASWRAARICSRRTSSRRARSTPTRRWSSRSRRWSPPTARRSRRRRSACRTAGSSRRRPGRAGAINVFAGSSVQPGGAALVTITQLDPIAVALQPAAAQPRRGAGRRCAAAAARSRRRCPRRRGTVGRQAAVRRQRGRRRRRARCASRPSSPTRTSGSGPARSSPSGSRCRR